MSCNNSIQFYCTCIKSVVEFPVEDASPVLHHALAVRPYLLFCRLKAHSEVLFTFENKKITWRCVIAFGLFQP